MGHPGANSKSPIDSLWKTLSRPISAPLLTAILSWRYEEGPAFLRLMKQSGSPDSNLNPKPSGLSLMPYQVSYGSISVNHREDSSMVQIHI